MSAYNMVQNDGFVIGYSYDSLDRPTAKKYNGTTYFTWRYNTDGNVTVSSASSTSTLRTG